MAAAVAGNFDGIMAMVGDAKVTVSDEVDVKYIHMWSSPVTWGSDFVPQDGDTVLIPHHMSVKFDQDDSMGVLGAVVVEGELIFEPDADPEHERYFDAHYVFVHDGGLLQIGTEDEPYTSKIEITMHGDRSTLRIPTYGNKVIGVREGTLDMHGVDRDITWSQLATTINPGDTTFTLIDSVDWVAGEHIVVASSSLEAREAEDRYIASVSETSIMIDDVSTAVTEITVTVPFVYGHESHEETLSDGEKIWL